MKTRSCQKPDSYTINRTPTDTVEVILAENIVQVDDEFEYDMYRITVPWREGLEQDISIQYNKWISYARNETITRLSHSARTRRDNLLAECDWTQMPDSPLSQVQKDQWAIYRQALRDIPDQPDFPFKINWPILKKEGTQE